MPEPITKARLRDIPLFSPLDDAELEALIEVIFTRSYAKNSVIINEGDETDALYIITEGKVKITKTHDDGREIVIAVLTEDDYFGEMSLIDEQPRSANVVTKTPVQLSIVKKEDFQAILLKKPELALHIMKGLSQRLRAADSMIESLALMDVYGRIARLLLDLAESVDDKLMVSEPLTHQDIANMVGSSREMVSRIMKDLANGGYISVKQKRISITNRLPAAW